MSEFLCADCYGAGVETLMHTGPVGSQCPIHDAHSKCSPRICGSTNCGLNGGIAV